MAAPFIIFYELNIKSVIYLESFRRHLKRKGKKKSVIERNIRTVQQFIHSLPKDADELSQDNIDSYVKTLEYEGESAKGFLYAMMNYF